MRMRWISCGECRQFNSRRLCLQCCSCSQMWLQVTLRASTHNSKFHLLPGNVFSVIKRRRGVASAIRILTKRRGDESSRGDRNPTLEAQKATHVEEEPQLLDGHKETRWLGMHRQSEIEAETYRRHTRIRTASSPTQANNAARAANSCLLYTSPSPRDRTRSRMPSSA